MWWYISPSINKYFEPLIRDVFIAQYADCLYKEDYFQALGGDFKYHIKCQEINWDFTFLLIPTYSRIGTLRSIHKFATHANNLPDSFTYLKGVTKSFNPVINEPERVEVPIKTTQLPVL